MQLLTIIVYLHVTFQYKKTKFTNKVWPNVFISYKGNDCAVNDFKIAHNIIFTNAKLFKYKMIDSPVCKPCNTDNIEDMEHLFLSCPKIQEIVKLVRNLLIDFMPTGFTEKQLHLYILLSYKLSSCKIIRRRNLDVKTNSEPGLRHTSVRHASFILLILTLANPPGC